MTDYSIYLPSYSIGRDACRRIGSVCRPYGRRAVVIGGKRAMEAIGPEISRGADGVIEIVEFRWYGGECSEEAIAALLERGTRRPARPGRRGQEPQHRRLRPEGARHRQARRPSRRKARVHIPDHRLDVRGLHGRVHRLPRRRLVRRAVLPAAAAGSCIFMHGRPRQSSAALPVGRPRRHLCKILRGDRLVPRRRADLLSGARHRHEPDVP